MFNKFSLLSGPLITLIFLISLIVDHTPMVVVVDVGTTRIKQDGKWLEAVLSEGFMEITNKKTIILVDSAEWPDEIDANRAKAAKERAEEKLHRQLSQAEYIRSQAALARALARLKVTMNK